MTSTDALQQKFRQNRGFVRTTSARKRSHDAVERGLTFKSDARSVRQRQVSVFNQGIIGKTAERPEYARIGFRAAKIEPGRNVERHLVAAVGKKRLSAPTPLFKQRHRVRIWTDA